MVGMGIKEPINYMALASLGCDCGGTCGGKVGLGLGDLSDAFSFVDSIPSTDPLPSSSFAITPSQAPAISPIGSGGYNGGNYLTDIASLLPSTPNTSGGGVSSSINWNSILQTWTQAGAAIAKSAAGANPTYQSYNPLTGATTTVFGDSTTASGLISSLATPSFGGLSLGTLLLIGGGILLIMGMKK